MRQIRRRNYQVHFRHLFVTLPESHRIPYQINSRAAFLDLVGTDHFLQLHAHLRARIGHRQPDGRRILLQPPPVPLVGKRFTFHNAHRREQSPTAHQASLTGRPPDFLDRPHFFIMKNVSMNHESPARNPATKSLYQPGMSHGGTWSPLGTFCALTSAWHFPAPRPRILFPLATSNPAVPPGWRPSNRICSTTPQAKLALVRRI